MNFSQPIELYIAAAVLFALAALSLGFTWLVFRWALVRFTLVEKRLGDVVELTRHRGLSRERERANRDAAAAMGIVRGMEAAPKEPGMIDVVLVRELAAVALFPQLYKRAPVSVTPAMIAARMGMLFASVEETGDGGLLLYRNCRNVPVALPGWALSLGEHVRQYGTGAETYYVDDERGVRLPPERRENVVPMRAEAPEPAPFDFFGAEPPAGR